MLGLFEMDNADSPEPEPEQTPSDSAPKPLFREAKQEADEEEGSNLGKKFILRGYLLCLLSHRTCFGFVGSFHPPMKFRVPGIQGCPLYPKHLPHWGVSELIAKVLLIGNIPPAFLEMLPSKGSAAPSTFLCHPSPLLETRIKGLGRPAKFLCSSSLAPGRSPVGTGWMLRLPKGKPLL